jgi:hypothetical protein
MGFGSFLLDLGKGAVNSMQAKQENINRLKSEYRRYSDDELKKKFQSSSGDMKIAAMSLLQERGYGKKK